MPELPEVETTRRGLEPHLLGRQVRSIEVREVRLRWPVPAELEQIVGTRIHAIRRRSKYLLLETVDSRQQPAGTALVHLGMSGSLRLVNPVEELRRHDHVIVGFGSSPELRYHDPRRFGSWHWLDPDADPVDHPLLARLGPEPLSDRFDTPCLLQVTRRSRRAIKLVLMDAAVVVGVGNIYACEALFLVGIDPRRAANRVAARRIEPLVAAIKQVLAEAIAQGGTTLRDFVGGDGKPGYFAQQLRVYGREGEPCRRCETPIRRAVIGQRSTWWCPNCQR